MQTTLHRFSDDDDWPPFEEYGPTMDRPVPEPEARIVPWKQRMRERGFCPNCLLEWVSNGGREWVRADNHRPGREELESANAPWTVRQDYDLRT